MKTIGEVKLEEFVGKSVVVLDKYGVCRGNLVEVMGVFSVSMGSQARGADRAFISFMEDDIDQIYFGDYENCNTISLKKA